MVFELIGLGLVTGTIFALGYIIGNGYGFDKGHKEGLRDGYKLGYAAKEVQLYAEQIKLLEEQQMVTPKRPLKYHRSSNS